MLLKGTLVSRCLPFALLFLVCLPLSATNLVVNGGFDTGDFTGWQLLGLGNPTCDSNVVQLNGIYTCNDGFQYQEPDSAYQGTYFMNFPNAYPTESAHQDLATTPGQAYRLTFAYSVDTFGFGDCALTDCSLSVTWNGTQVFFTTAATNPWVFVDISGLLATGSTTELMFTGFSNPGQIVLDSVAVQAIPEPSSLVLAASTLALAGSRFRSRRARS